MKMWILDFYFHCCHCLSGFFFSSTNTRERNSVLITRQSTKVFIFFGITTAKICAFRLVTPSTNITRNNLGKGKNVKRAPCRTHGRIAFVKLLLKPYWLGYSVYKIKVLFNQSCHCVEGSLKSESILKRVWYFVICCSSLWFIVDRTCTTGSSVNWFWLTSQPPTSLLALNQRRHHMTENVSVSV